MLNALIMAGDEGASLWPSTRRDRPRQFLTLGKDRSLLQQASDRIEVAVSSERTWVITLADYVGRTRQQLPQVPAGQVIGEPCRRGTATCIGLVAALLMRRDPDATMLVMPSDHFIEPAQDFCRAVAVAEQMVAEHPTALITFGIQPKFPEADYGYIQCGPRLTIVQGVPVYHVQGFHEKPGSELAEDYIVSGDYLWNSGIFVWRAATILRALQQRGTKLHDAVQRIAEAWPTPEREQVLRREYAGLSQISIDYAVLEDASDGLVVQAPFRWEDVDSWLALEWIQRHDNDGNTALAVHCGLDTHQCVIVSEPNHLIATVGVNNLLIVQEGNVMLIADRRQEGKIKHLLDRLRERQLDRYL